MPETPGPTATPLMKWVGGKKRMLPHVLPHYTGQSRVVEPFFGGGAVSFKLASTHPGLVVHANEKLSPIVEIYNAVRGDVDAFIAGVRQYADPYLALEGKDARRAFYYQLRERYMTSQVDGPEALFFMLWCAYSGLYRTGKQYPGRFNTSHGFGLEKDGFFKPDNLRQAALMMSSWTITSTDFFDTLAHVDSDTFVFLDPPYRETYDTYTPDGFNADDQLRVVEYFKAAAARGAQVVYTNKDTGDDYYENHFAGFNIARVPIRYQVNRNCADVGRPETFEVVITAK
jgi:DNA adenine methylase